MLKRLRRCSSNQTNCSTATSVYGGFAKKARQRIRAGKAADLHDLEALQRQALESTKKQILPRQIAHSGLFWSVLFFTFLLSPLLCLPVVKSFKTPSIKKQFLLSLRNRNPCSHVPPRLTASHTFPKRANEPPPTVSEGHLPGA